jgi:hypothetical protein
MSRRVLFLAGGRLAVYHWSGGELLEPLWFSADEDGLTEFALYLAHSPHDPVYLLVDVVEEEFREESIPHVVGGDRRSLLRTRLNRLFRDPTYSYAVVQGREPDGRRDDRVLFTALIRPDLLSPWIGQISKHKIPLAGIYSLPIVSETLIKRMPVDSDHALLVTLQSSGGLRQTFFNRQRIKLSRLAMMPPGETPGGASYVLGEIEKIRRYLNSLRQLPHDSPLDVYVVGNGHLLSDITRQSPDSLTTRHHLFELDEVAEMAGMKAPYGSEYSDRIFAHLLAKKRLPNQYAPASQTRHNTMYRARVGMIAASVVVVILSLFISVSNVVESVIAAGDTVSASQQTAFYDERYEIARKRMPKIPAEPQDIKSAVEMAEKLRAYKTTPRAMVVTLSEGLTDFPNLMLDSINWMASTNPDKPMGGREQRANVRQRSNAVAGNSDGAQLYQLALINGHVDPFNGNYREALAMVRQFAATLLALPEVLAVDVVELPLDIGSDSALTGNTEGQTGKAPFALRIVIKDKTHESN